MSVVIPFPLAKPARPGAAEPVAGGGAGVAPPVPLHDAVAVSRRRHRSLVAAAGRWALSRGLSLPADHIALWAAAAEQSGGYSDVDGLTGPWYGSELDWFLSVAVGGWCAAAGCPVPGDLPESLWYLYGFLADSHRLHPASDPLTELRAALAVAARFHALPVPLLPPPDPTAA